MNSKSGESPSADDFKALRAEGAKLLLEGKLDADEAAKRLAEIDKTVGRRKTLRLKKDPAKNRPETS